MRKNATKIAALALSLALTVTSVNVPKNASAATVKLNKTKATLYLNGPSKVKTTTLKVEGKKNVTFTSTKPKVAKVNKTTGKVTAKSLGLATIKAKVKNGKTYKCKVTVRKTYNPVTSLKVTSPKSGKVTLNLNGTKTKQITTTIKPAKASDQGLTYSSNKTSVATVSSKGKITAKKAGTAKITVKTKGYNKKNAHEKATVAVTVKGSTATTAPTASTQPSATPSAVPSAEPSTAPSGEPSDTPTNVPVTDGRVSVSLTNSIDGDDTVLAGTSAVYQISVKDSDGNPVANQNAVISLERDKKNSAKNAYKVPDSMTVVTTDAKGNATFIVRPADDKAVENNDDSYVGAYKYTVKVGDAEPATGTLKVAAIVYGVESSQSVQNLNGVDKYKDVYKELTPGTNVDKATNTAKRETEDAEGKKVEYVGAQQVSINDEHKVAFKTDVSLKVPGYSDTSSTAKSFIQDLSLKSGKYHTYETGATEGTSHTVAIPADYNLSEVAYATVRFNKLTLSKHTKAVVTIERKNNKQPFTKAYGSDDVTFNQSDFSLQIPEEAISEAKAFKIALKSEGQVDLGSNDGYDVKDIVYVYKSQVSTDATTKHWDGVKIDWKAENIGTDVYYDDDAQIVHNNTKPLEEAPYMYYDSNAKKYQFVEKKSAELVNAIKAKGVPDADCYNITYSVPAFPRTGNAIIKCSDKNGTVKKIFACATIRRENKNILYWNPTTNAKDNLLYEITEQEAKQAEDCTVTNIGDDGLVEVNTKKSGITHLVGEISSDDPKIKEALDAKNDHVYTSIMWNPVAASAEEAGAGIAFAGQTATVVAQLIDENNNPVAKSDVSIKWNWPKTELEAKGIKEVDRQTSTDTKGQAVLKLSAAKAVELCTVNAEPAAGSPYKVAMSINDVLYLKGADIYWVDLHLAYQKTVFGNTPAETGYVDTSDTGTNSGTATASVGETWEYASKVIAVSEKATSTDKTNDGKFRGGALKDRKIASITGIIPTAAKQASSEGVTIDEKTGRATVASDKTVNGGVIFRLNSANTPKEDVLITTVNDNYEYKDCTFIGSGSISANETLTLNYQFETVGLEMGFVTPNGNKSAARVASTPDEQIVYLQLKDSKGNPITKLKENERIKISVAGQGSAVLDAMASPSPSPSPDGYKNELASGKLVTSAEASANSSSNNKEAIFSSLSKVWNGKSISTKANEDGILAVKLKDTKKEPVVVTASYEEVTKNDGANATEIKTIATATQSYSFTDEDGLPTFMFDTKQESGQNKIYYASNEITIAFTNDILPTSVRPEQFIVWKGKINQDNDDIDSTSGSYEELLIKNVTVSGNEVKIALEGNISVTADTYFKVFVGVDTATSSPERTKTFANSIRYFFTSEDGQEISTNNSSIVFPADRKKAIGEVYNGNAINKVTNNNISWNSNSPAADITAAVEALALAGVEIPAATMDKETTAYLNAIQNQIDNSMSLDELQKAANEAIKKVLSDKDTAESAIGSLTNFQAKKLNGKSLKGAELSAERKAVSSCLTVTNNGGSAVSGGAINGPIKVAVTATGSAIDKLDICNATGTAITSSKVASGESEQLYFAPKENINAEVKGLEVSVVVETKYYKRTYTLTLDVVEKVVGKDADGKDIKKYVVQGKKSGDKIEVRDSFGDIS